MALTESFFKTFTNKELCDATTSTEVLLCLSCESRDKVHELVAEAVAAGGRAPMELKDHGFMVQHGFEDLDEHLWELVYMDPDAGKSG
jgi:predicted lactoylglutathione lyase